MTDIIPEIPEIREKRLIYFPATYSWSNKYHYARERLPLPLSMRTYDDHMAAWYHRKGFIEELPTTASERKLAVRKVHEQLGIPVDPFARLKEGLAAGAGLLEEVD